MYYNDIQISDTEIDDCYSVNFTYASYDSVGTYIRDSSISNNSHNGLTPRNVNVELDNVDIEDNTQYGIYATGGSRFGGSINVNIEDNSGLEYFGYTESFNWSGQNWTISDAAYLPANFWDKFLLWCMDWSTGDDELDVSGNTIDQTDTARFFPSIDAYDFGRDYCEAENWYNLGVEAFLDNEYRDADLYFSNVVNTYPENILARSSLSYLFDICLKTDGNMGSFRSYLSELESESNLENVVEDLTIKSYMAEKNYSTAINMLENVINSTEIDYIIESALLDQAYCYMKLYNSGERNLPANCRVKPKNMKELLRLSDQIRNGHFEYTEPNPMMTENVLPLLYDIGNYPNPFNPETAISFSLSEAQESVNLRIYNVKGQLVMELLDTSLGEGNHSIIWRGDNNTGQRVGSGLYFYQLQAGDMIETRKMIMIK